MLLLPYKNPQQRSQPRKEAASRRPSFQRRSTPRRASTLPSHRSSPPLLLPRQPQPSCRSLLPLPRRMPRLPHALRRTSTAMLPTAAVAVATTTMAPTPAGRTPATPTQAFPTARAQTCPRTMWRGFSRSSSSSSGLLVAHHSSSNGSSRSLQKLLRGQASVEPVSEAVGVATQSLQRLESLLRRNRRWPTSSQGPWR